MIQGLNIYL